MSKSIAAAGAAACVLGFAGLGAAHAADHPDFTGKWKVQAFVPTIKTDKGALPPLRPEARKIYDQRVTNRAAKRDVKDPIDACLPHGAARLMFAPYPFLLLQANGQLDLIQEANHTTRLIYIDQPPVDNDDPKWLGDSSAHWDGKTLVIDTINNDHRTWLDKAGLPHSDEMKVTERLSLGDGGKVLTDAITIDDPKTYTAPWTTTVRFRRVPGPMELKENVCTRDHRM
ncbi:MAG: hypothetical protein ACXWKY_02085 [Caulobacteraceae bacterium]